MSATASRELADQKDQSAKALGEPALFGAVVKAADRLVNLAEQGACFTQIRADLLKDKIRGNSGAKILPGHLTNSLMNDLELCSKLAGGAGNIHRPQNMLPEASTNRQERIVVHNDVVVFRAGGNARSGKLAVDFAGMGIKHIFYGLFLVCFFRQHDTACDCLYIGIGQLDWNGKPADETLKQRHVSRQCGLARTDQ